MTRNEIVNLVRENNTIIAWCGSKGAIVFTPDNGCMCLFDAKAGFFTDDPAFDGMVVLSGNIGLAAVDPNWDGDNSRRQCACCKEISTADQRTEHNLWLKAEQNAARTGRIT